MSFLLAESVIKHRDVLQRLVVGFAAVSSRCLNRYDPLGQAPHAPSFQDRPRLAYHVCIGMSSVFTNRPNRLCAKRAVEYIIMELHEVM